MKRAASNSPVYIFNSLMLNYLKGSSVMSMTGKALKQESELYKIMQLSVVVVFALLKLINSFG